ncbi:phosphoribosylamine--glycine ligase [Helicobacter sp. 11S03491-1]|uniref:phosphoribosylamine--glycine ligase n=1 Tax=Helicobacter sp. 11S03491-1 TaxID=1476196 RepID=UPI000BA6E0DC|nr:phosphoribosylamine--glycine ligase [Helicobacter sp. 11S03491-1]PAF41817.1 phosphoribosylamine--glycine ligase [Helicobacter sp. 11S03491-1]
MEEKILIIGSGGREYSMGRKFLEDSRIKKIYFCPGNGATQIIGENIFYKTTQELILFIQEKNINLVIIGPETPLVEGMSDALREAGIKVFGPSKKASQLEGSKAFMKDFVSRFKIPTATYLQTSNIAQAIDFIYKLTPPIVIKADGLCAGKGVIIAQNQQEAIETATQMLGGKSFGDAGKCIVIEEFLDGYELSVFALCDGKDYVLLPVCQDHKKLFNGDKGPNTGGMGAYAPTPLCDEVLIKKIKDRIIVPTLEGMLQENNPFEGILFAGIMVVKMNGGLEPFLLEFNVRFGDPECEVLLPLLKTPLLDLCYGVIEHRLNHFEIEIYQQYCLGVVIVSKDYPYKNSPPQVITIDNFDKKIGHLSFGGVNNKDNVLIADGGRILLCIGEGKSFQEARKNAYTLVDKVNFKGMTYRNDIGYKALEHQ